MLPIKKRTENSRSGEIRTSPSVKKKLDKDKENSTSIASGSKQCVREFSMSESKSNQEKKRIKQATSLGTKEKKMTGLIFKSLITKRRIKQNIPDVDAELEGLDKAAASSDKIGKLDGGSHSTNTTTLSEAKVSPERELVQLTLKQNRKRVLFLDESDTEIADVAKKSKRAVIEKVGPVERDTRGAEATNEEDIRNDGINVDKRSLLLSSAKMNIEEISSNKEKSLLKKKHATNDNENRQRGLSPRKSDSENADVAKKRKRAIVENVGPASVVAGLERDTRGSEERKENDTSKDAIHVDKRSLLLSSVNMDMEQNSNNEEKYGDEKTPLQRKRAKKDKSCGNREDDKICELQKECKKRMKKLIRKQKEEIHEFHQVWDHKKSKLELEHKLRSAIIRCIFKDARLRFGRLKGLDDKWAKEMEEHNLLKEKKLKDLEEEQLYAVDAENQKTAHWLEQAKALLSSKRTAVDGAPAGTSTSVYVEENDVKPSDISAPIGTVSNLVSTSQPEVKLLEGPEIVISEISDNVNHVDLSNTSIRRYNEDDKIGPFDALVNQRDGTDEIPSCSGGGLCLDRQILESSEGTKDSPRVEKDSSDRSIVAVTADKVCDVMKKAEMNEAVLSEVLETVADEVVDFVDHSELNDATNKGRDSVDSLDAFVDQREEETEEITTGKDSPQVEIDSSDRPIVAVRADKVCGVMKKAETNEAVLSEVLETVADEVVDFVDHSELNDASNKGCDRVDSLDAFVDQREEETEEITTGVLPEPPEQTEDASNRCDVLPLQVPEDECHQSLSDEVQNEGANVVERENDQQDKIANSEHMGTSTTNTKLENRDTPVVESQSNSQIESRRLDLSNTVNPEPSDVNAQPFEAESQLPDMQIISSQTTDGAANERQDQTANLVENQNDLQHKVATQEPIDTSTVITQSNTEPENRDVPVTESQITLQIESPPLNLINTVNPEPSDVDAQPFEAESQLPDMQIISSQTTDGAANEPQDRRANLVEDQNDLQHKVATQEPIDTSTVLTQSNTEPENRDVPVTESQITLQIESPPLNLINTVNPEPLILLDQDAPVVEEQDTLQNEATSPTPADNVETQTAECALNELPHEVPTNHIDAGSLTTVSHETSTEVPPSLPNNVNISQTGVDTYDILNLGDLQLEMDVGPLDGSNHLFPHPSHLVASFNSSYRTAGPLDNELERIRKETEQLKKTHEELMLRMKTDFENKIKEMIAQIRKEYETKHRDAEAEFRSKKNELEKNGKIVLMNKILAEALSSDLLSFHLPFNFTQYHTVRPPPVVSPSMQHIPSQTVQAMQHIPTQTVQAMQHIPSPTVQALQHVPSPTVQALQHIPSPTVQALQHIRSQTVQSMQQIPSQTVRAMQHSSLPQSSTPHHQFQAYQPPAAAAQPFPYSNWPPMRYYPTHQQQQQQHLGATHAPPTSRYNPLHQGVPQAQWDSFVLAPDSLRAALDYRRRLAGNGYFSSVGNVQGNQQASSGLLVDAVCLSDDD